MDQTSQIKLMAAGFRILQSDDQPSTSIKVKENRNFERRTLKKIKTKAPTTGDFKELLQESSTIRD